jgi:hypothetical protein
VQEQDPRQLARHVVVDRDDVDSARPKRLQSGLKFGFRHREVAVHHGALVASCRLGSIAFGGDVASGALCACADVGLIAEGPLALSPPQAATKIAHARLNHNAFVRARLMMSSFI